MLCSDCEHVRFPPHPDTSTETDVPDPQVAPGTSTPGSGSNKKITLSSLLISDDVCKLFCDSIDQIFRYAYRDINDTLLKLQKDDLLKIHKELVQRFVSIFPTYTDKQPKNRQIKKTLASDIYHLGYSLLQNAPSRDIGKIFSDKDTSNDCVSEEVTSVTELAKLISVVYDLQEKVASIEAEMVILREENVRLQKDCKHTCTSSIDPNHVPTETNVIITSQSGTLSDNSLPSSSSSDSDIDTVEEFQLTTAQLKRQKKLERRATKHRVNQKIVNTNTSTSNVEGIPATTSNVEEVPPANNQLRAATHAADVVPSVSNQLRAADTRDTCDIYVGQVHPNCDTDMINKHLTSLGARHNTQIQSLTRATNAKWRSYKVTVSRTLQDKVLNIDNWPSGIVVQPFRDNKKPRQGPFRDNKKPRQAPFRDNKKPRQAPFRDNKKPQHGAQNSHWGSSRRPTMRPTKGRRNAHHIPGDDYGYQYEANTCGWDNYSDDRYIQDTQHTYNNWYHYDHEYPSLYR